MSAVLNPQELENLSEELRELRAVLEEEVLEALEAIDPVRQQLKTLGSRAARVRAALEIARRLDLQQLGSQLEAIDRCNGALERVSKGYYGRCIRCNEAIELNRLKADPLVECCLSCEA